MARVGRVFFPVCAGVVWGVFSASSQLVISQVYGGGGNAGSVYRNDFIEILNSGHDSVELSGWSVQYASSSGGTWQVTPLAGVIAPGYYYLVQEARGSGGTTDLPSPDAVGVIAMAATGGKVVLIGGGAVLSGVCPAVPGISDMVGYGTAGCFEGSAPAPAPGNTLAATRRNGGQTDTDDNKADFILTAPAPRNGQYPPLPVQLVSFSASLIPPLVLLEWITLTEVHNFGFYIQRAVQGGALPSDIPGAFVPGNGTTEVSHAYSWRDSLPVAGTLRYRLRQVDLDGTEHFSPEVVVDASVLAVSSAGIRRGGAFSIWPNPCNPRATVQFEILVRSRARVAVHDVLGREIRTLTDGVREPGPHTLVLDGSGLASGVYFCTLRTDQGLDVKKLFVVR